jgi:DNA-directed RNA polymerase subunit RPC12/RpoP
MSISFNCEKCKKRVKAPDDAGGKYGNCPSCGHRLFIPAPHTDGEPELVLQPIDEDDDRRIHEELKETYNLTINILHETDIPDDDKTAPIGPAPVREMIRWIVMYLRQVADGDLDGAQKIETKLHQHPKEIKELLKKMSTAERPEPELANIPPKILLGLIKNLESQL